MILRHSCHFYDDYFLRFVLSALLLRQYYLVEAHGMVLLIDLIRLSFRSCWFVVEQMELIASIGPAQERQ